MCPGIKAARTEYQLKKETCLFSLEVSVVPMYVEGGYIRFINDFC